MGVFHRGRLITAIFKFLWEVFGERLIDLNGNSGICCQCSIVLYRKLYKRQTVVLFFLILLLLINFFRQSACESIVSSCHNACREFNIVFFLPPSPFFFLLSFCSKGARCSSVVRWVVGSILHGVDPLSYFSFQPVLHDWCNKGRRMCYPVCRMVLLIGKSSLFGGSGFPLSLSEWSLTICLTPYNRN